jgi:hypothetical protein
MSLLKKDLIDIAQQYYEASSEVHSTPELSPETERRNALWAQWIENRSSWTALRATLRSELPGYDTGETYSTHDGGPRCLVYPPKESRTPVGNWIVVGCISLLAPVYCVYGVECDYIEGRLRNDTASFAPPPSSMALPAKAVARAIETTLGFNVVPRDIAETPVHLFAGGLVPPETTLFHVLFTNAPSRIP